MLYKVMLYKVMLYKQMANLLETAKESLFKS